MILEELKKIVREQQRAGRSENYIRNALKEYLQVYVLYFIYTTPQYRQNLIFTGGTCLRHFFDLQRLSEDLDFDCVTKCDSTALANDLKEFFNKKYKYHDVRTAIKQGGRQILLKFPVMKLLGIAENTDSDWVYVKIDLSPLASAHYATQTSTKSSYGMNYAAKHYDLPSLMAGKLHAVLMRQRHAIKGRDYFDLLWFVKKAIRPNLQRLSDMLERPVTLDELRTEIDKKVASFASRHKGNFESDMIPLLSDPNMVPIYIDSFHEEYLRSRDNSFTN
jgi:predicted nucleotidyltransferase component of viral defense system